MDEITIIGVRGFGYHGVFESEKKVGQEFIVDLSIKKDLSIAGQSDALVDTVDYGAIAIRTKELIESGSFNLIERLATEIAEVLKREFDLAGIDVTVHKPSAPIDIAFSDIAVTIRR
jgi:dihydroneopterin aldolase